MFQKPNFPTFKQFHNHSNPIIAFFQTIIGIFIWIFLIIAFLIFLYTNWFTISLIYILNLIKPKPYQIPFLFSLLIVIFFFPITLLIILIGTFIKIIK